MRYFAHVDGAHDPELIPLGAVVGRLFAKFPQYPSTLNLQLEDARELASVAWDICQHRAASTERWEALKTPDNLSAPAVAGRAAMDLESEDLEFKEDRWEAAKSVLSGQALQQLETHIQKHVMPLIRHQIVDYEAFFTEQSYAFENFRRPSQVTPPQPRTSVSVASPAFVDEQGTVNLAGGSFSADRNTECLQAFVTWLEPALAVQYAADKGLDLSPDGVKRFAQDRHPQSFDPAMAEGSRLNMLAMADALESIAAGNTPEEAYQRHALAERGVSSRAWRTIAVEPYSDGIAHFRVSAAEMKPELMLEKAAAEPWNRYAYLEMQLGDLSEAPECAGRPRQPKQAVCRSWLREQYLQYAEHYIADAPQGWSDSLMLMRVPGGR